MYNNWSDVARGKGREGVSQVNRWTSSSLVFISGIQLNKCTGKYCLLVSIDVEEAGSDVPLTCPGSEAISDLTKRVIFEMVEDVVVNLSVGVHKLFGFKSLADKVSCFPLFEGSAVL